MAHQIVETILASQVATGGTFTVAYPSGYDAGAFKYAKTHKMWALQTLFESPKNFTVSFGAASATVTYNGTTTLPAGTRVSFQFNEQGADDVSDAAVQDVIKVDTVPVALVTLGAPATSDDDYFRAAASISAGGALTLLKTTLDVPRNIIITSAGDDSGDTFTVTGTDQYGATVVETIAGANAGIASGVKAFKTVSGIVASGASAGTVKVGFGDVLGLPFFLGSAAHVLKELQDNAAATAGTAVAGLSPNTKSTATTADVRGTYDPNAACDGSKVFQLLVALPAGAHKGNAQYAG